MTTKQIISLVLVVILAAGVGFLASYIFSQTNQNEKLYNFSITVYPPGDFECVLTPTEVFAVKGELATITITNTVSGGFDCQIWYEVSGGTKDACTFSKNPVNPGETTVLTIDTSKLLSNTTYTGTIIAKAHQPAL